MMNEAEEVEVDPSKMCWMRFLHRSLMGITSGGMRLCPGCFPDAVPDEPQPEEPTPDVDSGS